jgi:hypothetical protein
MGAVADSRDVACVTLSCVDVFAVQAKLKAGGVPMCRHCWIFLWRPARRGPKIRSREVEITGILATWCAGLMPVWDAQKFGHQQCLALMEDRATCQFYAQHIANCAPTSLAKPILVAMRKMAAVVDAQNGDDLRIALWRQTLTG